MSKKNNKEQKTVIIRGQFMENVVVNVTTDGESLGLFGKGSYIQNVSTPLASGVYKIKPAIGVTIDGMEYLVRKGTQMGYVLHMLSPVGSGYFKSNVEFTPDDDIENVVSECTPKIVLNFK